MKRFFRWYWRALWTPYFNPAVFDPYKWCSPKNHAKQRQ
jgi:hypothetical protein